MKAMNMKRVCALVLLAGISLSLSRLATAGEWYENIKSYGDMRYRIESFQMESNTGVYTFRDRQRIKARVGLQAALDDYWKADIRLTSDEVKVSGGNGDNISNNQTEGDLESKKPVWIDAAYIDYKILFNNGKLTFGKMNNPFISVGKSQLIYDGDLTPEGIAGNVNMDIMTDLNLFLIAGGFWVRETSSTYDPMIYAAQVGTKTKIMDTKLTAGVGYHYATDVTNQFAYDPAAANTTTASGYGNTLVGGKYRNNYMLGEGFIDWDLTVFDFPVKLYTDYVLNNGANSFNRGYIVGLVFNKAKGEGTWELGYNFRQLQKDAVLGAFCDSDFAGGGTNADGHQFLATYVPADGVKINLTMFRDRKSIDAAVNPFYNRFQGDLVLLF